MKVRGYVCPKCKKPLKDHVNPCRTDPTRRDETPEQRFDKFLKKENEISAGMTRHLPTIKPKKVVFESFMKSINEAHRPCKACDCKTLQHIDTDSDGKSVWRCHNCDATTPKTSRTSKKKKTLDDTFNRLLKKEDIDTAGVPDAVPDYDMAEDGDVVPQIGLDDRLYTETEEENEDDLNSKIVPSDTAVSGRLYTV